MRDLIENAEEFMASGKDNLKKERWNAAASDFFKALINVVDYKIYKKLQRMPKNHAEHFEILKIHFKDTHEKMIALFNIYRKSYNFNLKKEDALAIKHILDEPKGNI